MKVILATDVANLGEEGDVVEVAAGYARNFLLPRKLVSLYNNQNIAALETRKAHIEKAKEAKRKAALSDKEKINSSVVVIPMPAGENGKLFGSVSTVQIADELAKLGITIERKKIEVPGHVMKTLGDYKIGVRLYGNEQAELKVSIVSQAHGSTKAHANQTVAPAAEAKQTEVKE